MTIGRTRMSMIIAGVLAFMLHAFSAHAVLSGPEFKCFQTISKASQNLFKGRIKVLQKCKEANLKEPASCAGPDTAALAKLDTKFDAAMDKACALSTLEISEMGYPGLCPDSNPADLFTAADLKGCLKTGQSAVIDQLIDLEYDGDVSGPLSSAQLKCQKEIAKNSAAVVAAILKNVGKCRLNLIDCKVDGDTLEVTCKLSGIQPEDCATDDPKGGPAITKAKNKALAAITAKCPSDPDVVVLQACEPDQGTGAAAATCEVDAHSDLGDEPSRLGPFDLIDYQFARAAACGDNVVNNLNEECDGTDDSACPGQCGAAEVPDGYFACLCKTKPRVVIAEHSNADTDNGWIGSSSDGAVVEGGGYIVDLYDCDGFGNCNVGPSCSLAPHSPCAVASNAPNGTTSNSICTTLGQGTCRKERTANGPHCHLDIQKRCNETGDTATCTGAGNFCETSLHGAPVGQAAGGVAVCNVSVFSEDVVGTININTGDGSMKVRQRAIVSQPLTQDKPCPVCGGFCAQGQRIRCTVDGDCGSDGPCITAPVCSDGLRQDKPCRTAAPFGGVMPFFGTTSMDCPPDGGLITFANGLDINPTRKTGSVTLTPTFNCTNPGFSGKRCVGGTSEGRTCTVDSECPGGTCNGQCFCSGQTQPNSCQPACVGGSSDAAACSDDLDCPGGFCHPGDCRFDPLDTDSDQEGICISGPTVGSCSTTTYKGCEDNSDCAAPLCSACQLGETCVFKNQACFVNSGIIRTGTPGLPERSTAGLYCVPANNGAINVSAGFPGPGALIQHEHVYITP